MRRPSLITLFALSMGLPALSLARGAKPQAPPIAKTAHKIFTERCLRCHGANGSGDAEGVLVNSRAQLVKSKAVVPGDANSLLVHQVVTKQMPPDDKLPENEIAALREWVVKGAPDWEEKPLKIKVENFNLTDSVASFLQFFVYFALQILQASRGGA